MTLPIENPVFIVWDVELQEGNVKYEAETAGLIVQMWKCVNISAESGQNLHSLAQRSHWETLTR